MLPLDSPVALTSSHERTTFDCGSHGLNDYLRKFALANQQNQAARTYVAARDNIVVGYYTLAAGSVNREHSPTRVGKGLARHPIPIILLARLAVDRHEQGRGLGAGLLKDAMLRTLQAAEIIGCRALVVHAKDQAAKQFYERHGFEPSGVDELHLFLLLKDLRASLGIGV